MFNPEELKNIAVLIKKAPIIGDEALTVAGLLLKINELLKPKEKPTDEELEVNGFKRVDAGKEAPEEDWEKNGLQKPSNKTDK